MVLCDEVCSESMFCDIKEAWKTVTMSQNKHFHHCLARQSLSIMKLAAICLSLSFVHFFSTKRVVSNFNLGRENERTINLNVLQKYQPNAAPGPVK